MHVTIGVSFYNNETVLADTLRSIFAQTYQDWDLLLVNDGSTDGSLAIAEAVDDSRVTVVNDHANRGIAFRRNQIARLATGAYLITLDADDLMHPSRLEQQVDYCNNNPSVDVAGTATYVIDGNNALTGIRLREPIDLRPITVLKHGLMLQGTLMGRTEWFIANPQDHAFKRAQDHELWCRTYRRSTFGKIREPLYFYRVSYRAPRDYLKLYLLNGVYNRRLFRMYGPAMVGWRQTQWLILRSYLKDWVYRFSTHLGLQASVIAKRNQPLTAEEYEAGMEAINTILKTPVPGLPSQDTPALRAVGARS